MLGNLFKCPVNVSNSGNSTNNAFPIQLNNILENTMCSRVSWSQIQGYQFILRIIVCLYWLIVIHMFLSTKVFVFFVYPIWIFQGYCLSIG